MMDLWIGSAAVLIALIISLVRYRKLQPSWLRIIVAYLLLTFVTQPFGFFYTVWTGESNHFIFNLYQYFSFPFYLYLFYRGVVDKTRRMMVAVLIAVFLSFTLCNLYFGQGFYYYNTHTFSVGAIVTLLCCLLYFWELFSGNRPVNYFMLPMFWITTGVFFYFAGSVVYLSLLDYITSRNLDPQGHVYMLIMLTLNLLLFTLISIGLLPKKSLS